VKLNPNLTIEIMVLDGSKYRFPCTHTCSAQLDLPVYSTREQLAKAMVMAVVEKQDFGLVEKQPPS
jgi:hypothetical protein